MFGEKLIGAAIGLYDVYKKFKSYGITIQEVSGVYKKFVENEVSWDEICKAYNKFKSNGISWDDICNVYNMVIKNVCVRVIDPSVNDTKVNDLRVNNPRDIVPCDHSNPKSWDDIVRVTKENKIKERVNDPRVYDPIGSRVWVKDPCDSRAVSTGGVGTGGVGTGGIGTVVLDHSVLDTCVIDTCVGDTFRVYEKYYNALKEEDRHRYYAKMIFMMSDNQVRDTIASRVYDPRVSDPRVTDSADPQGRASDPSVKNTIIEDK